MRFIDKFEDNVRLYPDSTILGDANKTLTFREIDNLSGRVYAFIKANNIGKEMAVLIDLKRGVNVFIALLGIWKSGATGVVVEDFYPEDRKRFIYEDARCVFSINELNWTEIISTETLSGHEETDVHDASEIIYTSGSEGLPKGVVTEYGKLDLNIQVQGWFWLDELLSSDIMLLSSPMSAVLSHMYLYFALAHRLMVDIAPIEVVKNFHLFFKYIKEHNATVVGMPPAYMQLPIPPDSPMRIALLGGEGVKNVYSDKCITFNLYGSTESSVEVCHFKIDRNYDITPIGYNSPYLDIRIVDENGLEVEDGETGELCHAVPFTRGYINQQKQTEEVFVDGYFLTGDIARKQEDGNFIILGRKTDMIKINGNRIEPAEIEGAVKKVLGINWAFAKGFQEEKRSFICVYYNETKDIDYATTREELMKILPNYMIPTYFIYVDRIPTLSNGKIDRGAFKAPKISEYRAEYVAPTNALEELLCNKMAQILKIDRIGINDDFFLLGGDSMNTIKLATECNVTGLNTTDIYASRTPKEIANSWMLKQLY